MYLELLELVERVEGYFWKCDRPRFETSFKLGISDSRAQHLVYDVMIAIYV